MGQNYQKQEHCQHRKSVAEVMALAARTPFARARSVRGLTLVLEEGGQQRFLRQDLTVPSDLTHDEGKGVGWRRRVRSWHRGKAEPGGTARPGQRQLRQTAHGDKARHSCPLETQPGWKPPIQSDDPLPRNETAM